MGKKKSNNISVILKTHNDKNGGHLHIILDDIDNNHVSIGLSTKPKKGKNKKSGRNYPMEKSPLDDGKKSYMRRQGTVAPKKEYSGERTGTVTSKDFQQAKIYGGRAKQKYLRNKKDKKSNDVPKFEEH